MDTPTKIGRYEILGELGHGAMGTVYRAKDPAMDRVVALKTIISLALAGENGHEFRDRFFREVRAAGSLTHPGIVPVFDVGEHEGSPFLVMEFISGKTLADAIRRGDRLPLDRICELGQKIAEALGYAHQHGVVHRDIKPANILLTSKEAHGIERPKITDFGVAKVAAGHTTLTGQIVGTPAFMAPEQFTGSSIDGRADIFSLGVVLYWMATGEQPFPGESMTAVSYKVVHTEPVPPRKLNPSLPLKLESIILKSLSKNPDERYRTGEDLARELGELRVMTSSNGSAVHAPNPVDETHDANATYIERAPNTQNGKPPVAQPSVPVAPAKSKSNNFLAFSAMAVVVIGAGSWYLSHRKGAAPPAASVSLPATNEIAPSAAPQSPAPPAIADPIVAKAPEAAPLAPPKPATKIPASPASAPAAKAPAGGTAKVQPTSPAEKPPVPKADPPIPEPAAVEFNPKSLDPKANARLKIDAVHMPTAVDFIIEMNGKVYLRRSAEGNKSEFDDWFVPPGVHEFRVTAGAGTVRRISNTVSTEFKAKKKHTLKIELRTQGGPQSGGVPQGLYADSQIVLTLK